MRSEVLHERQEGDARFLARRIPVSARVVALVHGVGSGGRTAGPAAAIAHGVGLRREHTLLTGAGAGGDALDDDLGGGDSAGLSGVLGGRARLTEVAVRRDDRSYVYLPAGKAPPPAADLVGEEAFRRFVERIRERGGTLLLHVPESVLDDLADGGLIDGYVALGRLERDGPRGEVPEFGRVALAETPDGAATATGDGTDAERAGTAAGAVGASEAEAGPAEGQAGEPAVEAVPAESAPTGGDAVPEEPVAGEAGAGWSRHRARSRPPVGRIVVGVLVVAALAAAWWLLARRSLPDDGPRAAGPSAGAVAGEGTGAAMSEDAGGGPDAGAAASEEGAPFGEGASGTGGTDEAALLAALEGAPILPYSVLIASYASPEDAEERLAELREASGVTLFMVAPTPIRGAVYHRVLAGARPDTASAGALMRRLVEAGAKERESGWDVRPVRLAYLLGVHAVREDARRTRLRAEEAGVPAYTVAAARTGADSAYAVYAGAYESESAAEAMGALLEGAGIVGELRRRRGASR